MSFVDLATLSLHRRQEIEARIKVFLGKCDNAINDIEKLKLQASGFVNCLNCDPSEIKERFLNAMRQLDEYTYLLTDFNLSICKLDLPNDIQHTRPVQDQTPRPMLTPIFNGNYNLMDALSEPTPSTSKACGNMCPAEKEKRKKIPREEQLLIAFSSASCSSESVPIPYSETQEKQVQCQIDGLRNLNLDDSAYADDLNLPAQSVLQVDQDYPALIMHTDGLTLWMITENWEDMFDFLINITNYYLENAVELKLEEVLGLTHCAYYDDDSKCYYRALIIRVTEEDEGMAEVFLVDTGEVRCTPVSTIQRLHPRFTRTAPFARCCHLAGIDLSHESKDANEQLVSLIKKHIGNRYSIRIDDNSSESLGVYVVLPSGETLNDLVLQEGLAAPIDRDSCGRASRDSELDDRNFDLTQCPEYDDPVEAVTGYSNRDEMDICKHYKGGPEKTCFKGARCKKRHVLMHPDGWTLDRVSVPANVPTLPLPAPGAWLRVYVTHVAYYDKLYVQLDDNKTDSTPPSFGVVLPPTTLEQLVRDMNSPASRAAYKPLTIAPAEGELVAALYPPDEQWYRARVLSATAADQNVEVLYIDYGNIVWVKEDAVRRLEPRWCSLPEQAVRCTLAGVAVDVPTPAAHAAARDALVALAKERKLEARVVSRDYNEMTVELYDAQGYSVAEQLLTNPHVKPREYAILDDTGVKQKIVVP